MLGRVLGVLNEQVNGNLTERCFWRIKPRMSRPKEKESRHLNLTLDVNVISKLDAMAAAEKTSRTRVVEQMVNESGAALRAAARRNYASVNTAQTLLNRLMMADAGTSLKSFEDEIGAAEEALHEVLNNLAAIAFEDTSRQTPVIIDESKTYTLDDLLKPSEKGGRVRRLNSPEVAPPTRASIPHDAAERKAQELARKSAVPAPIADKHRHAAQTPRPSAAAQKGKARRASPQVPAP